jgi:2'-5' RNA ligase
MTPTAIRAFIAIELPVWLQDQLGQAIVRLQERSPRSVRWVAARNIHLTLKFLGNVSPENLAQLTRVIQNESNRVEPFDLNPGGLGAFPNKVHPRVIWIGVDAPPNLLVLQRAIDRETARLGYATEERPFSAHLTLGRVSQHAGPQDVRQVAETLALNSIGTLGTVTVDSLRLFRSDLRPGGAVYTPLYEARLGK